MVVGFTTVYAIIAYQH